MLIASLTLRFTAHPPSEPPRPARPGAPVGPPDPCGLATIVRGGGGAADLEFGKSRATLREPSPVLSNAFGFR